MQIVHFNAEQLQWMPVLAATKVYTGALVAVDSATPLEGVIPMPVAAGHNNTTNKDVPLGVVVGNNNSTGNLESDSSGEFITQVAAGATYGATKEYQPVEGEWPIGDRMAMVLVHRIGPETVLRAPIWDTASGTDLAAVAVSVASASGLGCTTAAATVATLADFSTIYIRSGAARGCYRTLTSASTTAHTWLHALPADLAIGDSVVVVNGLRPYGISMMQTDATGVFIDANAALTSHDFFIDVRRLDLSTAGNQYVEFTFTADNFCTHRA